MSKSGKIYVILALVCSIVTLTLAVMTALKKTQYMGQLVAAEKALRNAPQPIAYSANFKSNQAEPANTIRKMGTTLKEVQDARATLASEKEGLEKKLASAETDVQKLTTDLASTSKDLETSKAELEAKSRDLEEKSKLLTHYEKVMGGRNPEQIISELTQEKEAYKVLQAEKNIVDDKLVQLNQELQKMKELDFLRKKGKAPISLAGKVVAINRDWNFVVLNVGKDDHLADGVDLTVYRGNDLIGKVRTVSVDANTAIADILPDWQKAEIKVGDQVIF